MSQRVYFLYKFWVDVEAKDEAEALDLAPHESLDWENAVQLARYVDIDSFDVEAFAEKLIPRRIHDDG